MNPPKAIEERLSELEQSVASIDGKIVSSWAMQTRAEYEKEFKAEVKERLIGFATVFLTGAALFLAGGGYVLMKAVVDESVNTTYQSTIDTVKKDLEARYQLQSHWQSEHNTGVARRQLAEFYFRITGDNDERKNKASTEQMERLMKLAAESFDEAVRINGEQATSYWELGELYYTYPNRFGRKDLVDRDKALDKYQKALRYYTEFEREKGWKAQCYYDIGLIYIDYARNSAAPHNEKNSKIAKEQLEYALQEYTHCKSCDAGYQSVIKSSIPTLLKELQVN